MRLPKNLLSGTCTPAEFYLCNPDKTILGGLNVINANGTFKFNSYSEITCEIDRTYTDLITGQERTNPLYDKVEALRLLYVVDFGYFQIQQAGIVSDGVREYKNVTAYSLEYELTQKYLDLFTINMGTTESIDGVQIYSTADISHSLIHLALEKMNGLWIVGHVDLNLQSKQRSFEIDHQSIYDFLMNDLSDTLHCVVEFDTYNNTVNIYDEESYGKDTNIYISFDNLANSINVDYNADDIKTKLYAYGDSDISIREVNLGLDYVMNIDYYNTPEWLGQDLYDDYNDYCNLVESYRETYSTLMLKWDSIYDKMSELYNKIPDYDESDYDDIPVVYGYSKLPTASESNVYQLYRVMDGESTYFYRCEASVVNGSTVYQWVLDVDYINSFYTFPTPSAEYVGGVYKVYNKADTDGVLYYICESYQKSDYTTGYRWVLAESEYGIALLKEKEQCYLDIQEVQVSAGWAEKDSTEYDNYLENYEKLVSVQKQLAKLEAEYNVLNTQLTTVSNQMSAISTELKLENNFTPEQILRLTPFMREDEYTDDNFVITELDDDKTAMETRKELMEATQKKLAKICQPQLSFSMDMANILAIPEFEPIIDDFEVGNCVAVEIRPGYVVKTQILEVNINFDDMADFSVTFGNLTSLYSQIDIHAALLSQAVTAGKSVAQSSSYWKKGADTATSIGNRIESGLIDANTSIKSTENQAISWDSHGFHLRKYADESKSTYLDDQIWMNNEKIVFTDDNWRTAKMAIGKINDVNLGEVYGIIAPNLVGTLLAGENLVIDSAKTDGTLSSFRVDANGARLYNSTFLMEKEVLASDGTISNGQIMIDPAYGIVAGSDIYVTKSDGTIVPAFVNSDGTMIKNGAFPLNSNFFLDINDGNAYFRGYVYAEGGYFSGTIESAQVNSAVGNFSGNITATEGNIGGWTVKKGILYSTGTSSSEKYFVGLSSKYDTDDATTDYAIWAGALDPADATFSVKRDGTINAKNGNFTGTVTSTNGTIGGWTIQDGCLYSGESSEFVGVSSGKNKNKVSTEYAFWAGAESPYNAPFWVKRDGTFYAKNGTFTGSISWEMPSDLEERLDAIEETADDAYSAATSAEEIVDSWTYGSTTYIDGEMIMTDTIYASRLCGGEIEILNSRSRTTGYIYTTSGESSRYAVRIVSDYAASLEADGGDLYLYGNSKLMLESGDDDIQCNGNVRPGGSGRSLGTSDNLWENIYAASGTIQTSDRNKKHDINYDVSKYEQFFDELKPVSYMYNNNTSGRTHTGFISQDIEDALQTSGLTDLDFAGFIKSPVVDETTGEETGEYNYALRYSEFISLCVYEIQQLKKRVAELESAK